MIIAGLFIFACDSPTEVEDNIKKTSLEKNISASSGLLIEIDTSSTQPPPPKQDSVVVYDTTNFKGNNTGLSEFYANGMYFPWDKRVFWFDAFKVELDTLNKNISLNIDVKTNDKQDYYDAVPPSRIKSFRLQLEKIDYSSPINNMLLNSPLGNGRWASYTVTNIPIADTAGTTPATYTYEGRSSRALFNMRPLLDDLTGETKGLIIAFDFEAETITQPYVMQFALIYQLTLIF